MTRVSGHGWWPGGAEADVLAAQRTVLEDLTEVPGGVTGVPFLVQLAGRGPGAEATGRTAALLAELPVELGPHGWKLADHGGVDLRRARAYLRDDVEALAIAAVGWRGPLTVSLTGPWSLAARLYLARGDRVLADPGAVRDLTASLAAGLADHVAQVRAQVPGADVVVQLDEPLVGQVMAGVLPTFSGLSRLRAVPGPDVVDGLRPVLGAARDAGARTVVHVGAGWVGVAPVALAGADALGLDVALSPTGWDERTWEVVARAVERGLELWAGLPPATVSRCAGADVGGLADLVSVPWRRIGLPASGLGDVTLLDAARGAPAAPAAARSAGVDARRGSLATLVRAAELLAERADA